MERHVSIIVHEFPGLVMRFLRALPARRHRDLLSTIDEALVVLRPLVRPTVVEVTYVVMDFELGLLAPTADLDSPSMAVVFATPAAPVCVDLTGLATVRAEGRSLSSCVASRFDAPVNHIVVAGNGRVMASEARLPGFRGDVLRLETRTGTAQVPVRHDHDGAWVAGPLLETPTQPPIGVRWSYEGGMLNLDVAIAWSSWSEDSAGAYLVEQATSALVTSGWRRA
jgi:hypothetical protein